MIPTLWAIITINFFVVQIAPGGPVDQALANLSGRNTGGAIERITGSGGSSEVTTQKPATAAGTKSNTSLYRGARGLDPEVVAAITKRFGFDKPLQKTFCEWTLRFCGVKEVKQVLLHNAVEADDATRRGYLEQAEMLGREFFG